MTVDEMKSNCREAIDAGLGSIILALPWNTSGDNPRMCKTWGPTGRLICGRPGKSVVQFDAHKVLKWIEKNEV